MLDYEQRLREKRDAQQQQHAERLEALRRTSVRAASAEDELRRGAGRALPPSPSMLHSDTRPGMCPGLY